MRCARCRCDSWRGVCVLTADDRATNLQPARGSRQRRMPPGKRSRRTWRATERMINRLAELITFTHDTLGAFLRARSAQIELLRHPNPANRILHTEMIGEMNGYMHALLSGRQGYGDAESVLRPVRAYRLYLESPPAPAIPPLRQASRPPT